MSFKLQYMDDAKPQFRTQFPDTALLHGNTGTVGDLANKFRRTGSVQDRQRSGRPGLLMDKFSEKITPKYDNTATKLIARHGIYIPYACFTIKLTVFLL